MSTDPEMAQNGRGRDLRFWAAFGAVAITNLAASFDATTLSVALPTITSDIGGSAIEAFWAGTSYPLAATVLMLNWVALSQCFGRRPILLIVLTIFAIGAILSAVSQSFTLMLVGRTIQGVGAGGFTGLTTVVITDMVPLRQRGKFYALISAVWAVGSTTGPIIGGALAQEGSWRWIFWINLPIIGIGFAGVVFFLRLNYTKRSLSAKLKEIDYLGSFLFVASTTSFLIPVTWGGVQYPWSSWRTLVPLILGICGLSIFCVYESKTTQTTLIPLSLFRNSSVSILFMGSFFHGLILWALVYYMPEYFQAVKGYSAVISGVAALPQTVTVVPCAVGVGIMVGITGRYRWAIWAGWVLTTLGCGLLMLLDAQNSIPAWIFLEAVSGIGVGLLFPSIALAIQASVPQKDVAIAATMVLFFRSFGQTVGVAIGGTIFQNRMRANLQGVPGLPANAFHYASDAVALVEELKQMPPDSPVAAALRTAFTHSFRIIWAVMCGFAGVAMTANFFIKEYDMNQEHVTDQGFRLAEDEKEVIAKEVRMDQMGRGEGEHANPSDSGTDPDQRDILDAAKSI